MPGRTIPALLSRRPDGTFRPITVGMLKKFLKSETGQALIARLAAGYIAFVYRTTRWTVLNGHVPDDLARAGKPLIACFWHQRLMMMAPIWRRRRPYNMLISAHRDGVLISRTVKHFGINTITGSTSKGAAEALRAMVGYLKKGELVGVTPDGPRGPARKAAQGVAAAAFLAQAPAVTQSYSISRAKFLNSWDRLMVPLPFGKGVVIWGDPIPPPATRDAMDEFTALLEKRLDEDCAAADRFVGIVAPTRREK
jgi:lysophospholipid acyltransferase (LPLAT)-like uncharacterized protein